MRLLHTADLHLGQILYQYYDRIAEHDHFFGKLEVWCNQYRPDALVVCGDIFDIPQPGAANKEYFNHTLANLHMHYPDMAIVVIAGNHDSAARIEADSVVWGLSGVTVVGQAPSPVSLLTDSQKDRFIVELPKGFIITVPFMPSVRREAVQTLLDRVAERNRDNKPVVMCGHLAINGVDFMGHGDIGNQKVQDKAEMGHGYDYLALGHIHRPQTIGQDLADESCPASVYPAGAIRYSGSALHVSCDERYPHSVSLVDIESHGSDVQVTRLRIDELFHFYTLPDESRQPAKSSEEVIGLIRRFCEEHERGYFRLRLDYNASLPSGFIQTIYQELESSGKQIRFNPKTLWSEKPDGETDQAKPSFEMAELQQMDNPYLFVARTLDQFPLLDRDTLSEDFEEIRNEVKNIEEEESAKPTQRKITKQDIGQ